MGQLRMPLQKCKVTKVVDGDTLHVEITQKVKLRLARVDTPELRSKDPEERKKARVAKEFVENAVRKGETVTFTLHEVGNFGRYLADVVIDGKLLNQELVKAGLAKPYKRRKK